MREYLDILEIAGVCCWVIVLVPLSFLSIVVPFLLDVVRARWGSFKQLALSANVDAPCPTDSAHLYISVVVPAYREAENVMFTIEHAKAAMQNPTSVQFIVSAVDDATYYHVQKASEHDDKIMPVRSGGGGRGVALNAGADKAEGQVLLFLHADCLLPQNWDAHVRKAVCEKATMAGAFSFDVHAHGGGPHGPGPLSSSPSSLSSSLSFSLSMLKKSTNFRSQALQLPYGDQALFITAARFRSMGGFPDLPLMEDYEFITNLRRAALHHSFFTGRRMRVQILPQAAQCSIRRWAKKGVCSNTLSNQIIVILYVFGGMDAKKLFSMYYGNKHENIQPNSKTD